jgi:phosphopantothenoylcysteine decarboxylase/phosphopantothenate--cysteine ligase
MGRPYGREHRRRAIEIVQGTIAMQTSLTDKTVVLGVCGGIAAYKSAELLRRITQCGASVRVILTANAARFVGPLTFEALSGQPVCHSLFEAGGNTSIQHIEWAQTTDAVVIAPATANIIGKLAGGIADDALSTFMLAVTSHRLLCPSMNTHMYQNDAVQQNLITLRNRGYQIVEPGSGLMACGTTGPGRLPEPAEILDALLTALTEKDLFGKHILITAGPTREHIDPVRFISNPSSGKMGFAIAQAAAQRGATVSLISGPSELPDPYNVRVIRVTSAKEMADAVFSLFDQADAVIKTAAVSDYRPKIQSDHKIKKGSDDIALTLEKTTDILKELGKRKKDQVLVGFAAETQSLHAYARQKLLEKNLDFIVGNLVGEADAGFGAETNKVTLFYSNGASESLALMPKHTVAGIILDRMAEYLNQLV